MNPNQYAIYKGTGGKFGAAQFNLQPPHFYKGKTKDYQGTVDRENNNDRAAFEVRDARVVLKEGWKQRDGAVFVEVAPTVDKNTYDWKQKIVFALSVGDLGKSLYFLQTGTAPNPRERDNKGAMSIMHDPGAKSTRAGETRKWFKFYSPKGPREGMMLTLEQQDQGKDKLSHKVPVTGDEVMVLRALFTSAISSALNW